MDFIKLAEEIPEVIEERELFQEMTALITTVLQGSWAVFHTPVPLLEGITFADIFIGTIVIRIGIFMWRYIVFGDMRFTGMGKNSGKVTISKERLNDKLKGD